MGWQDGQDLPEHTLSTSAVKNTGSPLDSNVAKYRK